MTAQIVFSLRRPPALQIVWRCDQCNRQVSDLTRPAVACSLAIADAHDCKAELDAEALRALFPTAITRMHDIKKLEGKTAIITGGNSGIGLEAVKLFVAEGAQVIITGRRQDVVDAAVAEIGAGAFGVQGDVGNLDDLDRLVKAAEKRFGKLDIYFANAAINPMAPFGNVSEEMFD
jgi:short chain dehydrogenase